MSEFTHSTLAGQEEADVHRQSYNAAFEELGLSWHWDRVAFARLSGTGRDAVRGYIQQEHPHLLRAYEVEFLVEAIESAKARCHEVMTRSRARAPWYPQPQRPAYVAQAH